MKNFFKLFLLVLILSSCSKPDTCPVPSKHPESITMKHSTYKDLNESQRKLLEAAEAVMKNSYNPYSKFFVGAALEAEDGTIISGTNFENAAYGSTICAERAAILRANAMGYRKFKAIAIIGKGLSFDSKEVIAPCGACRQVIYEVSDLASQPIEVIMSNTSKDKIIIASINQLLPLAFGPKDLGVKIK